MSEPVTIKDHRRQDVPLGIALLRVGIVDRGLAGVRGLHQLRQPRVGARRCAGQTAYAAGRATGRGTRRRRRTAGVTLDKTLGPVRWAGLDKAIGMGHSFFAPNFGGEIGVRANSRGRRFRDGPMVGKARLFTRSCRVRLLTPTATCVPPAKRSLSHA